MRSKEEDFYRLPDHVDCNICRDEVAVASGPAFCGEHLPQYEARQREGVTTDKLDLRWDDTLDNWRERPSVLDGEVGTRPSATPLLFWQMNEDWLLFMRFYAAKYRQESRLGDGLAINIHTGEIRRFVDVSEDDIWNDLRGVRSAPYQGELAAFWGDAGPIGLREKIEQRFLDEQHRVRLSELVHAVAFPVYGLVSNPLGLSVCSVSWGSAGYRLTAIGFIFSSPLYAPVRDNFSLSSSDAKHGGTVYNPRDASGNLFFDLNDRLFERYQLSDKERGRAGSPSIWEGEFPIAEVVFSGEIRHWSQPYQLSLFHFESEKTHLNGSAFGLSQEELLRLLEGLRIINHSDDLLAQYQRELDAERQRLSGEIR